MVIRKSLASLAAAGLLLGSTAAVAAPAVGRSATPVAKSEDVSGIPTFGIIIGVLIAAAVIAIIATKHHHHPVSP